MTRLRTTKSAVRLLISGLALGLSAALALAAPAVIDRVPDDAMFIVLIPSPDALQKHIGDLGTAIEFPIPVPPVSQMLAMAGITAGVDTSKAVALCVLAPPAPQGDAKPSLDAFEHLDQRLVALFPVSSYADFLNNFNAKPSGAGQVDSINLPSGMPGFAKDVGSGYVAISDKKALLEPLTGKSGANALKSKLSKTGDSLSESSDVALLVNIDPLRPYLPAAIAQLKAKAKEQAAAMGAGQGAEMESKAQALSWLVENASGDARSVVSGVKISSQGVSLDHSCAFKDGSLFGKAFASGGSPSALLAKLPAQDFILAGAIDTSMPAFRDLLVNVVSKTMPPETTPESKAAITEAITSAEGHSGAIGFPKGGLMAGLLTSAISYSKAKDPSAAVASLRKTLEVMEKQPTPGLSYKSTYTEGGAKVADKTVDVWDVKVAGEGEGNQMVGMGLQWMFGRNDGFGGYVAKTPDGLYRTYSKNSELLSKALTANVAADSLAGNKLVSQVADRMPSGRVAEGYIGTRSLLETVAPFIAMTGVPVAMDKIPEQLPPIGIALSADAGTARWTVFVPTPVIKTGVTIGRGFAEQMHAGDDEAPAGHKDGKGGTGQPKF